MFYDSEAKKLFDDATGANELKMLERLYSAYFSTSIGDNAADRLGDLYYELGRFDRAADCWLDVLRERTDTDLSPALLIGEGRTGAQRPRTVSPSSSKCERISRSATLRDKVTLAGQTAAAPALLDRLLKDQAPAPAAGPLSAASSDPGLSLPDAVEPEWQMRFGETVEAGMTPAELTQWEQNALSATVPAVCINGPKLFANYLSYLFAIDLKSGKLLWRSAAFHNVEVPAMQNVAQFTDTSRYTIIASGEHVWTLSRDSEGRQLPGALRSHLLEGRERRDGLAIERPLRLRRARPERSADPGGRKNLHPGVGSRETLSRARAACSSSCWRSSRTTAR